MVSRGPYVKSKEPFGAFFIIIDQDMDEAVEIVSKHLERMEAGISAVASRCAR